MDISILKKRIFELSKEFNQANLVKDENTAFFFDFIKKCAFHTFYGHADIWKKAGLRVESKQDFMNCTEKLKKSELGKGAFGTVYRVHANKCIRNVPANVKHFAVKVELYKPGGIWGNNKTPERIKETFDISKRMGTVGIGPKVYDRFIVILNDEIRIVTVYELIEGATFKDMKWKNPEHKQKALVSVQELVYKMNKMGILHSDIHGGNIMIDKKGRVVLIDFDFAKRTENVEQNAVHFLNVNFSEGPDYLSENAINFYIHRLLKEGIIKM
jgi:predicted Ser/Thr protein kinase